MNENESIISIARALRLATVQNFYNAGELTEDEAREILSGRLCPDDPDSVVDDSDQLKNRRMSAKEAS